MADANKLQDSSKNKDEVNNLKSVNAPDDTPDPKSPQMDEANENLKKMSDALKDSFDVREELKTVTDYANLIIKYLISSIRKLINFINKLIFSSFEYISVVLIIFAILLAATLLFSSNKYGNLLVLCYFFIGFLILFLYGIVIWFFKLIFDQFFNVFNITYDVITMKKSPVTFEVVWAIICAIFWWIIAIIFVALILLLGFVVAWAIKMLNNMGGSFYDYIKNHYQKNKINPVNAAHIVDSGYSAFKQAFDMCTN